MVHRVSDSTNQTRVDSLRSSFWGQKYLVIEQCLIPQRVP